MGSRQQQIDTALAAVPRIGSKLGTFLRRDGVRAVVAIGGTQVALPYLPAVLPPVGHPVQIETRSGAAVVTGLARPLPDTATVTAVGEHLQVAAWGGSTYTVAAGYSPAAIGDTIRLTWGPLGGAAVGLATAGPAPLGTAPNPGPSDPGTFHPRPFLAADSGSYNGTWFTRDVYATGNTQGAWWYGSTIADTIPDTARITTAAIFIPYRQLGGGRPRLRLHRDTQRPGAGPDFTNPAVELDPVSGWANIPPRFIEYLIDNPGGLGFDGGGNNVARGRQADAMSGALDIAWTHQPLS